MSMLPKSLMNVFPQIICAALSSSSSVLTIYSLPSKTSGPFRKSAERIPDGHNRKVIPADDGLSAL
jgi:hypothetical protein